MFDIGKFVQYQTQFVGINNQISEKCAAVFHELCFGKLNYERVTLVPFNTLMVVYNLPSFNHISRQF